jgi:hypothetical protein
MAPHFVPGDRQSVSYRKSYASRDDEGCDPDGQDIKKKEGINSIIYLHFGDF